MPSNISFTLVFDCDLSAVVAHSHAIPLQNVDQKYKENQVQYELF